MKKIFAVVLAVMITGSVFAMDFTKWNSSLEDSSWIIDAGVGYGLGVAVPVEHTIVFTKLLYSPESSLVYIATTFDV